MTPPPGNTAPETAFATEWETLQARLPRRTFFSNPRRFEIDADNLENLVGKVFEAHASKEGQGWFLAGRSTSEALKVSIGPMSLKLPLRFRLLRTIADSVFWDGEAGLEELVSNLRQLLREGAANKVHLHYFRPPSPAAARQLEAAARRSGLSMLVKSGMPLYRCALAGSGLDSPSLRLKSKTRNTLARKTKKLESQSGAVDIRTFTQDHQADEFFAAIELLSPRTWQRHSGMGGLRDNVRFRQVYRHECSHGRMRSYLLFAGDRPIAYQFGTIYDGIYNYEILGFDSEFGDFSPGQLLRLHAFDELFGEGVKFVDFGPGEYEYKSQWGTEKSELFEIEIYGGTAKSRLVWLIDTFSYKLIKGLKTLKGVFKRSRRNDG